MIVIVPADAASITAAYQQLTGRAPLEGRVAKLLRIIRSAYSGSTIFGTLDVSWEDKQVTLGE